MWNLGRWIFGFLLGFVVISAEARWATQNEAAYRVNFEHRKIKVRKDGSATIVTERQIEILKDKARLEQGLMRLQFNATTSSLRVLEAKTINPTETLKVPKRDIENKPMASSGIGFDVINQMTIAFPEVSVGSKLYLRTELVESRANVPGLFFFHQAFWGEWLQKFELNFDSEIPLYLHLHDSDSYLNITKSAYSIRLKLKSDYFKLLVEEENVLYQPESLIWIAVSSMENWNHFPLATLTAYERDLASPLPAKFQEIALAAQQQANNVARINTVTSMLAERMRYVGDWRALEGLWHPRSLAKIAQTGYGDCKDFTISTGAILRRLGFETHAAWIGRGNDWVSSPLDDKVLDINHAILYAKKDGEEFWIDPTNVTSFAQGVYPDIQDRNVLLLLPEKIDVRRVPNLRAEHGGIRLSLEMSFEDSKRTLAKGNIKAHGTMMLSLTGAQLSSEKKALDYRLLSWITNEEGVDNWNFGEYDLISRVVQDFSMNFSYLEHWRPVLTSAGQGYAVQPNSFMPMFKIRRDQRQGRLKVWNPGIFEREIRIRGREIQFGKDVQCKGSSNWVDYSRLMQKDGKDLILKEKVTVKKPHIEPNEIRSVEFEKLQTEILECLQDVIVIFR